jgi:hypothetical protein
MHNERVHCDACIEVLNARAEQAHNDWWGRYEAMTPAEQSLFWDEQLVKHRLMVDGRLDA